MIVNGAFQTNWASYALDFAKIAELDYSREVQGKTPTFSQFDVNLTEVSDTFIDMTNWGKGDVLVNGFNIGRYWHVAP